MERIWKFPWTAKLSTAPTLVVRSFGGDTEQVPSPRLAKASAKSAMSAGLLAYTAARTALRCSLKSGSTGVSFIPATT